MILRRKRLPDHLEAPSRALDELIPSLERAKAALTESVPGTRLPGRPLAETLSEFEEGLREVRGRMGGWRAPEVEQRSGSMRPLVSTKRSGSPNACGPRAPRPKGSKG